jgi:hypothetical protein
MSEPTPSQDQSNTWFFVVAAGMMVVIMGLLAGLWLRERQRAVRAQRELKLVRSQKGAAALGPILQQALRDGSLLAQVVRADLDTQQVDLDGRSVMALKLPAETAQDMGFVPGDVILVQQSAPTAATAPAADASPPGD